MQSVAAVYNRIERAALRHDREPLYAWLSRRTDNAVKEAIKHGLRMANDPDYRLGVEAGRFARDYAEAFEGFIGTGEKGQRYRGLQEGALRLRAGGDTVSGATATRREVERLLGVMRAEIEAARAPAPVTHAQPETHHIGPYVVSPDGAGGWDVTASLYDPEEERKITFSATLIFAVNEGVFSDPWEREIPPSVRNKLRSYLRRLEKNNLLG